MKRGDVLIVFILLNIMLILLVKNNKLISNRKVAIAYFICLFFTTLYGIEYASGNIELFTSDEAYYVFIAENKLFDIKDNRFLWYFINYLILNYDIAGTLFLKLINVPILISTLVLLARIFQSNKIFNALFFLPYLAFMTIYNLRDILILFVLIISVYSYYNKSYIKMTISSMILFYLRPQYVFIIFGIIVFISIILSKKEKKKKTQLTLKKIITLPIFILLIILLIGANYNRLSTVIDKNMIAFERHINNEAEFIDRMKRTGATGNIIKDLPISMLKYTFSPLPTSLFQRIINGGDSQWSLTDDIVRLINQCGYYLLLGYLVIHYKYFKRVIFSLDNMQLSIILILFSYMPIYSFYLYGVMHQRLRLPFQVMIYLFAIKIYEYRKKRR
jgi:hypothetical protein